MTTTTPEVVELALDVVKPHPHNARRVLRGIPALADSIKENGLLQSCTVAPIADGGYLLIAGHRRHAALTYVKLPTIRCEIRWDLDTEIKQRRAMLAENLQRDDFNEVEEGDAYQGLLDLGVGPAAISKDSGRPQKVIRDRAKLASAPEHIRAGVITRDITLEQAVTMQRYEKTPEIYADLERALGTVNWKFAVERAKETDARTKARAKIRKALVAEGVRVFEDNAAHSKWFIAEQKARGVQLWSQILDDRPDDAASSPDVAATFGYNSTELLWERLAPIETADAQAPHTASTADSAATRAAERAAAAAEREQLAADLTTSATVRTEHLALVVKEGSDDIAQQCMLAAYTEQIDESDIAVLAYVARLLNIGAPTEPGATNAEWDVVAEGILTAVAKYPTAQLAILLRITESATHDENLTDPEHWHPSHYRRKALDRWRDELVTTFGYEWSDVEAELLTALAEAGAE